MLLNFHQTVAAIIEKDRKFLMVKERTKDGIKLNQPAGHLESNETLLNAVIRETKEETACKFFPENFLGIYKWQNPNNKETFIRYAFIGSVDGGSKDQDLDDAIIDTLWLTAEQILTRNDHRSILVGQCLQDYLSGLSYPLDIINEIN